MTDIEQKALALANEVFRERGHGEWITCTRRYEALTEALCRAIERHEAFRQEVSDAVAKHWGDMPCEFDRFIIAKPDPLVEAVKDCQFAPLDAIEDYVAKKLRAALAARGLEIREVRS